MPTVIAKGDVPMLTAKLPVFMLTAEVTAVFSIAPNSESVAVLLAENARRLPMTYSPGANSVLAKVIGTMTPPAADQAASHTLKACAVPLVALEPFHDIPRAEL